MQRTKLFSWASLAAILCAAAAQAEVRLPKVFSSHMVLQQDKPLVFWGWAQPGEKVTVKLDAQSVDAVANDRGEWKAELASLKAGGPHTVTVSAALRQIPDAVVVPRDAVNQGPESSFVLVTDKDSKVWSKPVTVLNDDGTLDAIQGDVHPGDKVVTDGQLRVTSGQAVRVTGGKAASAPAVP